MIKIIISGGQTGADRAGLDFAIQNKIPHIGFCPIGRKAEDGIIHGKYRLTELGTGWHDRTVANLTLAEATVIFSKIPISGGSLMTGRECEALDKPYLLIPNTMNEENAVRDLHAFVVHRNALTLNIAGNRESKCPGIYQFTLNVLNKWLKSI